MFPPDLEGNFQSFTTKCDVSCGFFIDALRQNFNPDVRDSKALTLTLVLGHKRSGLVRKRFKELSKLEMDVEGLRDLGGVDSSRGHQAPLTVGPVTIFPAALQSPWPGRTNVGKSVS